MEFFLLFLRTFSQLHVLLEPPRLLIFEGILPPSRLLETPRLFVLGENPNYKILSSSFKHIFCYLRFSYLNKSVIKPE